MNQYLAKQLPDRRNNRGFENSFMDRGFHTKNQPHFNDRNHHPNAPPYRHQQWNRSQNFNPSIGRPPAKHQTDFNSLPLKRKADGLAGSPRKKTMKISRDSENRPPVRDNKIPEDRVLTEREDFENKEPGIKKEQKSIPTIPSKPHHSIFWHRSIGSVHPPIRPVKFRSSLLCNIPMKYFESVFENLPKTDRKEKYSPDIDIYIQKFLPPLTSQEKKKLLKKAEPPCFTNLTQAGKKNLRKIVGSPRYRSKALLDQIQEETKLHLRECEQILEFFIEEAKRCHETSYTIKRLRPLVRPPLLLLSPSLMTTQLRILCSQWKNEKTEPFAFDATKKEKLVKCGQDRALWYGQFCLICEKELSWKSIGPHIEGSRHEKKFKQDPRRVKYERVNPEFTPGRSFKPEKKKEDYKKPFPLFGSIRRGYTHHLFLNESQLNTHQGSEEPLQILVCGDFDFSYSLGLHRITKGRHHITCCPLSSSEDPRIQSNIDECRIRGIITRHDVDMNQRKTIKFDRQFDKVIFVFPQVSFLQNLADPINSFFVRSVFLAFNRDCVMKPNGYLYLLLKKDQFIEWDLCTIGINTGFYLQRAVYHHSNAFLPFDPKESSDKFKRLQGGKAPIYYILTRSRNLTINDVRPWDEPEPEESTQENPE